MTAILRLSDTVSPHVAPRLIKNAAQLGIGCHGRFVSENWIDIRGDWRDISSEGYRKVNCRSVSAGVNSRLTFQVHIFGASQLLQGEVICVLYSAQTGQARKSEPDGGWLQSFSIITTDPTELTAYLPASPPPHQQPCQLSGTSGSGFTTSPVRRHRRRVRSLAQCHAMRLANIGLYLMEGRLGPSTTPDSHSWFGPLHQRTSRNAFP